MNEIMLSDVLEKVCIEEAAAIPDLHVPKLSFGHRRRMKRIFSLYQRGLYSHRNYRIGMKRAALVITVIFLAMFTVTAGAAAIRGFNRKEHRKYTELLTANSENCPKTIENVYYIPELPEGYKLYEEDCTGYFVYKSYINYDTSSYMVFTQRTKEEYEEHFDNEHQTFEELEINGYYSLYIKNTSKINSGIIVWDNGNYILSISGFFTKEELIELAKSTKF